MSGVLAAGVKKPVVKGPKWMKETLLDPNTYHITNDDSRCQKTLLWFQSKTFGPVRIVQQSNLYDHKKGAMQNHRLVVLGEKDALKGNILAELHYSPRIFAQKNEIHIHQMRSVKENLGLGSALLSVLCHLIPGVPKTLTPNSDSRKRYLDLGFVPSYSDSTVLHLNEGKLKPQAWVKKKYFLFKGKRKVFIK